MSLAGVIALFITMGWTALLMFVLVAMGDVMKFLQGPAVITFIVGYIIIILVFTILRRIAQSM